MVSWPSGLRRSTQVRVSIWRRGFESHWNQFCPYHRWPCGAMDSALDFESSGCRFESCQGRFLAPGTPRACRAVAAHARVLSIVHGGLAQSVECVLCKHEAPGSKPGFSTILPEQRQVGRVVKAVDSKSTGLRPRQFESGTCRSICLPL